MQRNDTINLGNLVLSLSDALDLANPSLAQHQQRTAFIVWEMGKIAGLSDDRMERCFIAALLHDVGAFSLEEKIALHNSEVTDTEEHCIRGELLLEKIPLLQQAAKIIRFHHKSWKDWDEAIENNLVFESQILSIADSLERLINRDQYILHQNDEIIRKLVNMSNSNFHPEVVDLLIAASIREEFWLDLVSTRLYALLLNEGPYRKIEVELSGVATIAELFQNIIDFRSRFTATHSSGVAAAALMLAGIFGLTEREVKLMEVAGKLHDLGKLVIPNSILDKPGKLSKQEMDIMKSHTYYTYSILKSIGGFHQIAEWAAYHHEKLDGSGYPFRCRGDDLSTGARILMVADLFTALAEDRPYREGMTAMEIIRIIKSFADRGLIDRIITNMLFDNFDEIYSYVAEKQSAARAFYENQFEVVVNRVKA